MLAVQSLHFIKFVMSQKRKSPLPKHTSEQQERLTDLVEENQLLYDVTMKDHRDRRVITNTWKKIARELDVEEFGCKCMQSWNVTTLELRCLSNPVAQQHVMVIC